MIKRIQEIFQKKKRAKLRDEYLDAVAKHPEDTRSRLKLGDMYARDGMKAEAVAQYMASAEIFSRAGFHLKSIALFKQVLKLDPGSVSALRKAASISLQYGLFTDAVPYFERLAEVLRSDPRQEALLNVYDEVARLSLQENRYKAQLYEAVFPAAGASFTNPYERVLAVARGIGQEGPGREDARTVIQWIASGFPDGVEVQEMLLSFLTEPRDHGALVKALDRLESVYRNRGVLEEKGEFLKGYRLAAERMAEQDTIQEKPRGAGGKSASKVKVQMEANVYDLLKKKSQESLGQGQTIGGDAEGGGEGRSMLDRLEFKDLFETFKESIGDQVAKDDSETHYNLGVAYREMDLFEDAVEEFRVASRSPAYAVDAYFMMGNCFRELERLDDALEMYARALAAPSLNQEQACAIRYEKASVLAAAGKTREALDIFKELMQIDCNYRDIEQRIQDLS